MSEQGGNTNVQSILANPEPIMEYTPIAMSAPGRVCAADGCDTILSVYNHSPFCCLHQPEEDDSDVPDGCQRCTQCGMVLPLSQFKRKSKEKDGVVYEWHTRSCLACLHRQEERWRRDNIERCRRRAGSAAEKKRKQDAYYRKRYGQPSKEAYLAAKRAVKA